MEALYREHILKEAKPQAGSFLWRNRSGGPKAATPTEKKEEVFGD